MKYDEKVYEQLRDGEVAVDLGATDAEGSLRLVWTATHETVPAEVHEVVEELLLNGLVESADPDTAVLRFAEETGEE